MIRFEGFGPDLDPATPGIMTDVTNIVPTAKGFAGAPTGLDAGYSAFATEVRGIGITRILSGDRRIFVGTTAALYELSGGTATDRSRGGGYTLGADARWQFAQFGNVTLAATDDIALQASTGASQAFADISGAPKAKFVAASRGFVMVANTNDATYGDQSDRWWNSGFQDYTTWTPSVTAQSNTGRIIESPGPITGLKELGEYFVIYKERALFLGSYVGGDEVWRWSQIPGDVGVISNEAVINIGYAHLFVGTNDFYVFDGTRSVSLNSPLREWFFDDMNPSYAYKIWGAYDRINSRVYWFYASNESTDGSLDKAIIYHLVTQKWGKMALDVQAVAEYLTSGITYDNLGSLYATYDDLPTNISYESPYWTAPFPVVAYADDSNVLKTLTGLAGTSQIVTGIYGNDETVSLAAQIRPRFFREPTSSTMTNCYDMSYGDNCVDDSTVTLTNGKYCFLRSARFHKFKFDFVGPVEIIGFSLAMKANGRE